MIRIEFDEKSVFTFSVDDLAVHIYDHQDGKYKGPIIGEIGYIKFASRDQLIHFSEMLDFIIDAVDEGDKNN